MIIAAFAGVGKTTLAKMHPDRFTDFVCMPYKYYLPGTNDEGEANKANFDLEMREEWPYNYTEAIMEALKGKKTLLIPTVMHVLFLLEMKDIPYTLCYPRRDAKEVYRQRYIARGNTEDFLSVFIDGWDEFMGFLETNTYATNIVLEANQFLSDVINV